MKYKNTKTGAIIDSPFKILGKNWVEVTDEKEGLQKTVEETTEEYVEEEIDLEEMTKAELVAFAKEQDIKINERDTKDKIIKTIAKHFD